MTRNAQQASLQLGVNVLSTRDAHERWRARSAPGGERRGLKNVVNAKATRATKRETEGCRGPGHVENVAPRASQGRRFVSVRAGNGADRDDANVELEHELGEGRGR